MYDEESARDMAERMKNIMPYVLKVTGMDMAFAKISASREDTFINYIVPSDDTAAQVIKLAFGDKAVSDGVTYVFRESMSRKKVMVPAITDVLEANPKK